MTAFRHRVKLQTVQYWHSFTAVSESDLNYKLKYKKKTVGRKTALTFPFFCPSFKIKFLHLLIHQNLFKFPVLSFSENYALSFLRQFSGSNYSSALIITRTGTKESKHKILVFAWGFHKCWCSKMMSCYRPSSFYFCWVYWFSPIYRVLNLAICWLIICL